MAVPDELRNQRATITYTYNGKQYVTVQVGLGSVNVARMGPQLKNVPRGGSVWTFALME